MQQQPEPQDYRTLSDEEQPVTKEKMMSCYKCKSKNIMERKGIANKHNDYVCLDCGHTWKPTVVEVFELRLVPIKKK